MSDYLTWRGDFKMQRQIFLEIDKIVPEFKDREMAPPDKDLNWEGF